VMTVRSGQTLMFTDWHTERFGDSMPMLKIETAEKLAYVSVERRKATASQIMNSPCKVKYVGFYQHRDAVSDPPSCRRLVQFKTILNCNPDCET
jgi:hypothetical protein